jgi:hypothetical protein
MRPAGQSMAYTFDPAGNLLERLWGNDPDVPLDLQHLFEIVYEQGGYDYVLERRPS